MCLYFQTSKFDGVIWQVFADGQNGGPVLGLLDCWEHSAFAKDQRAIASPDLAMEARFDFLA